MIRIVTDSAADITLAEAEKLEIEIVPLKITFEGTELKQETEADYDEFFEKLKVASELPITSRPSPNQYIEIFKDAEKKGQEVLVLTLSSGLSGTYESAVLAQKMSTYKEHIRVVDTKQAILTQRMLVEYALKLRDSGENLEAIVNKIEDVRERIVVCGVVDTLKYLKMGGRIPKSLAFIGETLKIKPVIILENTKLRELAKKRGTAAGKKRLYQEFEKESVDPSFPVYFGYTLNRKQGQEFMKETVEKYRLADAKLFPVGSVIGTHVGPDCLALAFVREK
ncbi:DegV family protein [Jeotgalibaca ciconiae]|uniref:DegV family protein n=1 Tax=Jeotgalibaca ciconiae TaxID=2496265 RepID=UPI001D13215D|nr:DegV family protein [Jeotgalibaca ciconiae]